jgi:dephospho-CoA kinase
VPSSVGGDTPGAALECSRMRSPVAIAVVGMAGAGKSEASKILLSSYDFDLVYFGQVVLDEIAARGFPSGPESERRVREELREEEGMAVMAVRSLRRINTLLAAGRPVCIDGLYSGEELRVLSAATPVITLAVHAPRWLRKRRLAVRSIRPLTSAEVDERDVAEVLRVDKATPIALADAHVVNDAGLAELQQQLDKFLAHLDEAEAARIDAFLS